ncbi:MAG: Rrf2 family transcriptional regulator [Candidatus Zixiibacteriota bacterium]
MLTKGCEYAIRAAVLLTHKMSDGRQYVPVREIADELEISFHFLTKLLQILTEAGIMMSFRGPNGGVALARKPSQIRVREIVVAIDGEDIFKSCVLGLPQCGNDSPCPLHREWAQRREQIDRMFERATLAKLARGIGELNLK